MAPVEAFHHLGRAGTTPQQWPVWVGSAENYMWDCRVRKIHARRTQSDGSIRAYSEVRYKGIEEKKKRDHLWKARTPSRGWSCGSGSGYAHACVHARKLGCFSLLAQDHTVVYWHLQ
jgi:hypothetical protein